MKTHDHFPMFIDIRDKRAIVIGGGNIAERRLLTLSKFSFQVAIIADRITDEIQKLTDGDRIRYVKDTFTPERMEDFAESFAEACMVLACTDDRQVNAQIGAYCREHGIPVNVCDAREESTFWFPALATNDELVMGLTGDGNSHETVRKAAATLRRIIEERSY